MGTYPSTAKSLNLPNFLWSEVICHGNWLLSRLPSKRINEEILILNGTQTQELASITYSNSVCQDFRSLIEAKLYLQRSNYLDLFSAISSAWIAQPTYIRFSLLKGGGIIICRNADFETLKNNKLSGVTALVDGISRKIAERNNQKDPESNELERQLIRV